MPRPYTQGHGEGGPESIRTRPPAYGSHDPRTKDPRDESPVSDGSTPGLGIYTDRLYHRPRPMPPETPGDLARQKLQQPIPHGYYGDSTTQVALQLQAEANRIAEAQVWALLELARVQDRRP